MASNGNTRTFNYFYFLLPSVPPLEGNAGGFHPPAPPNVYFVDCFWVVYPPNVR